MGADMVEVSAALPSYPQELLKSQCEKLGTLLNSEPRGLALYYSSQDPKFKFLRASFAIDGIINRDTHEINLNAIVQAFLGAPEPYQVSSFMVILEGEKPVDGFTLKDFSSSNAKLLANVSEFPVGIEYRILTLTQDPKKVDIPMKFVSTESSHKKSDQQGAKPPSQLFVGLVAIAGICVVVLVYFAISGRKRS